MPHCVRELSAGLSVCQRAIDQSACYVNSRGLNPNASNEITAAQEMPGVANIDGEGRRSIPSKSTDSVGYEKVH
jgi:hypothetical protein